LYASRNIISEIKSRRIRWEGYLTRMAEIRNAYNILGENPEGKGLVGRPKRRREDSVRMNLRAKG
jgi:hypothetical protein